MSVNNVFRVLLIQEQSGNMERPVWVAQALDMDFAAHGDNVKDAQTALYNQILDHFFVCNETGSSSTLPEAPQLYFELYNQAYEIKSDFFNFKAKQHKKTLRL